MNLPIEVFGDIVVVHAPEEIGADQTGRLQEFLTSQSQVNVILDLDGTETFDSRGLECLLNAWEHLRERQGDLRLSTRNKVNRVLLEITRVDRQLDVFDNVLDAVKSFS